MLLNRKTFELEKAASKDATRYALNAVHIEEDGSAVACDGHVLVRFTPTEKPDPKEYPDKAFEGVTVNGTKEKLKPFSIPLGAVRAILRTVPKNRMNALPILRNVVLDVEKTNKGTHAVLAFTDLKRPTIIRPEKVEAEYPDVEKVVPKGKPSCVFGLTVTVMQKALTTLAALDVKTVSVNVFQPTQPLVLKGETYEKDGSVFALVMPATLGEADKDFKGVNEAQPAKKTQTVGKKPAVKKPKKK